MKNFIYILDEDKNPVEIDLESYLKSGERHLKNERKVVAKTKLPDGIEVSTVFLMIDHGLSDQGPPLVFETMIFGGERDTECYRYSTWQEAEEGHFQVVRSLRPDFKGPTSFNKYDILDLE